MNPSDLFLGMLWAGPLAVQAAGAYLTRSHFENAPIPPDTPFRLLPVSILKPLKGLDEGLEQNLRSFFELDYPEFELLFSIASPADPSRRIVKKLMGEYPHVRSRLLVGETQVGINPKINNLIRSYDEAAYHWILISDSNVRVGPRYLKNLASQITADTGVITSVVVGTGADGLGARLEAMYLNTFYARGMILASQVDEDCVVGKSMLFRKSSADRFGGLRALGNYLAEDYITGEAMRHLGLKVSTAWHPVPQHIGRASFSAFWKRHIRWGRIRRAQAPLTFLGEFLTSSVVSGFAGAFAIPELIGCSPLVFLGMHFGLWLLLDMQVLKTLRRPIDRHTPLDWVIREALSPLIWFHTCAGNTVEWRGKKYQLSWGGMLTPVESAT